MYVYVWSTACTNLRFQEEKTYKFAHVFDGNDTQRDVFNRCAVDFVGDLSNGRNSLLFTYGKPPTYTISNDGA